MSERASERASEPGRVAVVGADGRMGRMACALLEGAEGFRLVGRARREEELDGALEQAELALDLTVAGLGARHAERMLERGVRPVVATSGVTPQELARLDALARERGLGGRVVANLSRGAWLLARLAREAAALFGTAEIVETHHDAKRDAPSATARALALELAETTGARVPIHALRLPGALASHAVHLGAPGELVELRHDTTAREAFAPGILFALALARCDRGVHAGLPWERWPGP